MRVSPDERRQQARFTLPVVIDAPALSEISIVPEDVSTGGFRVIVTKEPTIGDSIQCAIQIMDEVFLNCQGRIVWKSGKLDSTDSWAIGFRVDSVGKEKNLLELKLQELISLMKKNV